MTTTNDITGDKIESRATTDKFRSGWDAIFGDKSKKLTDNIDANREHDTMNDVKPSV